MKTYQEILSSVGITEKVHYKLWVSDKGESFACGIHWESEVTITIPVELFNTIKANPNTLLAVKKGTRVINDREFTTIFIFVPKKDITQDEDYFDSM